MSQMEIEIDGLELIGFHGATRSEQETGQRFLFDVWLVAHDAGVEALLFPGMKVLFIKKIPCWYIMWSFRILFCGASMC